MALYGRNKDVLLFQGLNTELLHKIIEQQVGYYKPKLDDTPSNVYGEAQNKTWIGPVLLKCLLERGDQTPVNDDFGVDRDRSLTARFFRMDLVAANVIPEIGDVLWYCAMLASEIDVSLGKIMEGNLEKLNDRKQRGTLQGSGDTR